MRDAKYLFLLSIILITTMLKADVLLFPMVETSDGPRNAYSLEGIASYEIVITDHITVNNWGGIGAVGPITRDQLLKHPALGVEIAQEVRYYDNENFSKFNVGLYIGASYMYFPYHDDFNEFPASSLGFVPGFKFTYKHKHNSNLVSEPYIGFSMPFHYHSYEIFYGPTITAGIRFGFNKIINSNDNLFSELVFPW